MNRDRPNEGISHMNILSGHLMVCSGEDLVSDSSFYAIAARTYICLKESNMDEYNVSQVPVSSFGVWTQIL